MQPTWLKRRSRPILVSASLLVVFLFFLGGCTRQSYVDISGEKIIVEIADTPEERGQGLMFRESLCEDCGMLFVFEEEGLYSFWMKNTLIPLDMIFIDADGVIVTILSAEPCVEEPCESYTPIDDAKYVLEVNKDYSLKNAVQEGDTVAFYLR